MVDRFTRVIWITIIWANNHILVDPSWPALNLVDLLVDLSEDLQTLGIDFDMKITL